MIFKMIEKNKTWAELTQISLHPLFGEQLSHTYTRKSQTNMLHTISGAEVRRLTHCAVRVVLFLVVKCIAQSVSRVVDLLKVSEIR